MVLGTHNSMTYLPLKKWYMYPFRFMSKCQSKNIDEQYKSGARIFDLRISFTKRGEVEFRHGMTSYKGNVLKTLSYLNSLKDDIKIRLMLENTKYSKRKEQ